MTIQQMHLEIAITKNLLFRRVIVYRNKEATQQMHLERAVTKNFQAKLLFQIATVLYMKQMMRIRTLFYRLLNDVKIV